MISASSFTDLVGHFCWTKNKIVDNKVQNVSHYHLLDAIIEMQFIEFIKENIFNWFIIFKHNFYNT